MLIFYEWNAFHSVEKVRIFVIFDGDISKQSENYTSAIIAIANINCLMILNGAAKTPNGALTQQSLIIKMRNISQTPHSTLKPTQNTMSSSNYPVYPFRHSAYWLGWDGHGWSSTSWRERILSSWYRDLRFVTHSLRSGNENGARHELVVCFPDDRQVFEVQFLTRAMIVTSCIMTIISWHDRNLGTF